MSSRGHRTPVISKGRDTQGRDFPFSRSLLRQPRRDRHKQTYTEITKRPRHSGSDSDSRRPATVSQVRDKQEMTIDIVIENTIDVQRRCIRERAYTRVRMALARRSRGFNVNYSYFLVRNARCSSSTLLLRFLFRVSDMSVEVFHSARARNVSRPFKFIYYLFYVIEAT